MANSQLSAAWLLEVYNYGEVGAGKLVKFPVPAKREWITLPKNAKKNDQFATFTVTGNSLIDIGIEYGDTLVCRRNFELSEIKPDRILIILFDGELQAKRLRNNHDGTVTIISAGGEANVFEDEIEIKALAIEHKRLI